MKVKVRQIAQHESGAVLHDLYPVDEAAHSYASGGHIQLWLKEPLPFKAGGVYELTLTEVQNG